MQCKNVITIIEGSWPIVDLNCLSFKFVGLFLMNISTFTFASLVGKTLRKSLKSDRVLGHSQNGAMMFL
jgi:hypothetical protein